MEDISVFTDKNAEPAESDLSKTELKSAKVYAEGRGIRIEITNKSNMKDIQCLIDTKLEN